MVLEPRHRNQGCWARVPRPEETGPWQCVRAREAVENSGAAGCSKVQLCYPDSLRRSDRTIDYIVWYRVAPPSGPCHTGYLRTQWWRYIVALHGYSPSRVGINEHGIEQHGDLYWNLPAPQLYEHAIRNGEAKLAANGAMVCTTGPHTGRSPNDKFLVDEETTTKDIWWGKFNRSITPAQFDQLHQRVVKHYQTKDLYVRDMFAGADESSRLSIRVITETAWHNLFASQLFIRPQPGSTGDYRPEFTILNAPTCHADPATDGTNSEAFIVISFQKKLVLIGGTAYAGEIKKSVFTIMNYLLPKAGVLSMHCSANIGTDGDTALFFGLSGTGKTTLSADPNRRLIGDDEHGWGADGVFNIEGGCYAKCIHLTEEAEPQIFNAIRFGAVLENVVMDESTRNLDYESSELTENTRAAYPLEHIDNALIPSVAANPKNVVFLTCDAFGVLPPISKLTPDQAMYHFLSGYTAKVAGTEKGVTEPTATFSACFGAPFLPLPPETYATMLGQRLAAHKADCWLVNTGWTGGGYGVGKRMNLAQTRAMVNAALSGKLSDVAFVEDPIFSLFVPQSCPQVPSEVLSPRGTWRDGGAYDAKARHLAELFMANFKTFENASSNVVAAGPRISAPV
ncbi:MAG: phosphoenolpyruvate carboxykinase (ATP) [Planctomycetes bacterium]|nr:phosphoenolpyruvate carboxykinase (ATP) [Planctomycetota bacterium]